MNFTINVNAQPGSAVQIAMGNQPLPAAKPMLPGKSVLRFSKPAGSASAVFLETWGRIFWGSVLVANPMKKELI